MKISVNTESLKDLAVMAKEILADISDAEECIRKIQIQLEAQTCHTIKEQLSGITDETETLQQHICNVRDDLNSISDIYEETEEEITREVFSLGGTDSVVKLMPVIEPIRVDIKEIPVKIIGPNTQDQIRVINIENEIKFRRWHENNYILIPERNLIIDDWIKSLIMEAYTNERI